MYGEAARLSSSPRLSKPCSLHSPRSCWCFNVCVLCPDCWDLHVVSVRVLCTNEEYRNVLTSDFWEIDRTGRLLYPQIHMYRGIWQICDASNRKLLLVWQEHDNHLEVSSFERAHCESTLCRILRIKFILYSENHSTGIRTAAVMLETFWSGNIKNDTKCLQ